MFKVGKHVTGYCRSDVIGLLKGIAVSWKLERVQERQPTLLVFAPLNDWQGGPGRMISEKTFSGKRSSPSRLYLQK